LRFAVPCADGGVCEFANIVVVEKSRQHMRKKLILFRIIIWCLNIRSTPTVLY
jgi:hypothetical protein